MYVVFLAKKCEGEIKSQLLDDLHSLSATIIHESWQQSVNKSAFGVHYVATLEMRSSQEMFLK